MIFLGDMGIWPFKGLNLMILTMTKYLKNLLKDSPLSLLSVVKFSSLSETKKVLKIHNGTCLRITRYSQFVLCVHRLTKDSLPVAIYNVLLTGISYLEVFTYAQCANCALHTKSFSCFKR